MKPRFIDGDRIKKKARELPKSLYGPMRLWHAQRYKAYQGILFEDRTLGDLMEEYYTLIVVEVERLRAEAKDGELEEDDLDRLGRLEDELKGDRYSLRGLSEHESLEAWHTPHYTGDPLADYWEYRISRDLFHPEELDLKVQPPREMWGEPWEMIKATAELLPPGRLPRKADFVEAS